MQFLRFMPILLLLLLIQSAVTQNSSVPKSPDTPKRPVDDEYQGVKVADDYRWLENWDDPAVKQWSAAENARSREYLDRLPTRSAIKEHLHKLVEASSASYYGLQYRAGLLFA